MSKSRWVAEIVRKYAAHEWPKSSWSLAGRFPDFALIDSADADSLPSDVPRIGF